MKKTTKSLADETNCLTKRNLWFNLSYQIELTPFWSYLVLQSLLRSSSWVPEEIGLEMLTFTFFFLYLCFQLHTDTDTFGMIIPIPAVAAAPILVALLPTVNLY